MIVTITEPKIKIVQIGQEVTLRCNVDTQGQVRQYPKQTNRVLIPKMCKSDKIFP